MNLLGVHDREAASFSPPQTWILDTISLAENPTPPQYDPDHSWIIRANWGYGSTGTIPLDPADQNTYITRLMGYLKRSQNVSRIVIGNEPNLPREWPNNQPIYPNLYADFFRRCRDTAYDQFGTKYKFFIAAAGPWNDQLKYQGNQNGDWIKNFLDTITACQGELDGFSIHSYTHGYNVSLVTAQTFMDAPFQNRHYDFQTYHDYLNAIPDSFSDLEVHITETNGGKNWQAVGLIPAMAADIDTYNRGATHRKIKSLIIYRYPNYDEYHFKGITPVEKEYLGAVAKNFKSPETVKEPTTPTGPTVPNPPVPQPPPIPEKLVAGKPTTIVQASILNVRDKPGTEGSKIIGTKKMGDKISVLDEKEISGDWWYQIGPNQWVISEWTNRPHAAQLSDWQRARKFTGGWEGGFQNLSWDPGNWTGCDVGKGDLIGTNFGVSACSYPKLDIKNLTREQADEIFYRNYWLKTGCDKLPFPMNLIVYDTAVNFGATTASYWLEKSGGDPLIYIGLRLKGYRNSKAWPQAGNAWIDRTVDLIGEATQI
jgi:hypothetical protein